MKMNGVIFRKIKVIEETIRKLGELGDVTTEMLSSDFFLNKGIERSIQVCIESVIDIAHRIISLEGSTPCITAGEALDAIERLNVIETASLYKPMVQFRNVVVHQYEGVDKEIVVTVLSKHLNDFERFISEVRNYAENQS